MMANTNIRSFLKITCIAITVLAIGILYYYPQKVMQEARRVANGMPYCVQIAEDEGEYRPARTQLSLSPFTMQSHSSNGLYMEFHALLILQTANGLKLYNWSYGKGAFVEYPRPEYWPFLLYCKQQNDFLDRLPSVFSDQTADSGTYIRAGTQEYSIPKAYRPRGSSYDKDISFVATAPDFKPLDTPWESLTWPERFDSTVELKFGEYDVNEFLGHQEDGVVTKDQQYNQAGTLVMKVDCGEKTCRHIFLQDDIIYKFSYPLKYLPDRRQLQQSLIKRVKSFQPE